MSQEPKTLEEMAHHGMDELAAACRSLDHDPYCDEVENALLAVLRRTFRAGQEQMRERAAGWHAGQSDTWREQGRESGRQSFAAGCEAHARAHEAYADEIRALEVEDE